MLQKDLIILNDAKMKDSWDSMSAETMEKKGKNNCIFPDEERELSDMVHSSLKRPPLF